MTEHLIQDLLGELTPVHKRIAPRSLYVAGDVELVRHSPKVAVVGSRKATSEGLANAARVTRALVKLETTVVSGLAAGIDSLAHRSAIKAGGRTFAVIGTGFDRAYPAKNRPLQNSLGHPLRCREPVCAWVAGDAGELPPAKPDDGALKRCVGHR